MNVFQPSQRRTRGGKTLLEMMVVIATSAMLVSMAGGLFYHLSQTNETFREAATAGNAQMRLANRFRVDARGAVSAKLQEKNENSQMVFVNGKVITTYTVNEQGIGRLVSGGAVTHRDLFRIGEGDISLSLDDGVARIESVPSKDSSPGTPQAPNVFRIVVAVGADRLDDGVAGVAMGTKRRVPVVAPVPQGVTP